MAAISACSGPVRLPLFDENGVLINGSIRVEGGNELTASRRICKECWLDDAAPVSQHILTVGGGIS